MISVGSVDLRLFQILTNKNRLPNQSVQYSTFTDHAHARVYTGIPSAWRTDARNTTPHPTHPIISVESLPSPTWNAQEPFSLRRACICVGTFACLLCMQACACCVWQRVCARTRPRVARANAKITASKKYLIWPKTGPDIKPEIRRRYLCADGTSQCCLDMVRPGTGSMLVKARHDRDTIRGPPSAAEPFLSPPADGVAERRQSVTANGARAPRCGIHLRCAGAPCGSSLVLAACCHCSQATP